METKIKLKPGSQSTEFIGKVVLQAVLFINIILQLFKVPSIAVSPEMTVAIAASIEGIWMIFRQWNKKKELEMQQKTMSTEAEDLLREAITSASGLQASQMSFKDELKATSTQMGLLRSDLNKPGM